MGSSPRTASSCPVPGPDQHEHVCPTHSYPCPGQIFPGLILSDIKPAKRMKFKTVCYLLVQLMHCRKMFKAEIPFSSVTCEDDKVGMLGC